jgi:hypothetical protein
MKLKQMGFAGESYDTVLSNLFAKLERLED